MSVNIVMPLKTVISNSPCYRCRGDDSPLPALKKNN